MAERDNRVQQAVEKYSLSVQYLPKENFPQAAPHLQTGDICLLIREFRRPNQKPWLDCDHLGLILREADGSVQLLHAAPPRARRQDLTQFLRLYPGVKGFIFLRLRANASQIIAQELGRLDPDMAVPSAIEQDGLNEELRARRGQ